MSWRDVRGEWLRFLIALPLFLAFDATAEPRSPDAALLSRIKAAYIRPAHIPYPSDNPYSAPKAELGKVLFFETRISHSRVVSCATCHNPGFDWSDANPKAVGVGHRLLVRKTPTLLNLAWDELYFWDGRAEGLEQQVVQPIRSDGEMDMPLADAVATLGSINGYRPLFAAAFRGEAEPISEANLARAIATFVRTVVSGRAPFDAWLEGEESALSSAARRGLVVFHTKGNCVACHAGWRFSDGSFHDIGLHDTDPGRGAWIPLISMQHAFKTVGLRNISRRAPYMHDGSIGTLMEVIDHYDHGFAKRDSLADEIKPLHLTQQEKDDLVEFLLALTSTDPLVTIPRMPR